MNILNEAGLDPSPERRKGTWRAFIRRHAATLWASDFVGVKTWTRKGLVDLYLLFFLHIDSRRVFVSGITAHPDQVWVGQQRSRSRRGSSAASGSADSSSTTAAPPDESGRVPLS